MVQKKLGRPRAFDKNEALLAALNVFWARGYEGASMTDLKSAMGINAPSLYAVFGDKQSLYLQAIDHYANDGGCLPLIAFESEPDIKKAVKAFMQAAINYATKEGDAPQGCFMSSCVATSVGTVEGTRELLKESVEATDKRLADRFRLEIKAGVLDQGFPALERARLMFDLRQGHVLRARAGCSAQKMKRDLDFRVKMILFGD